MPVELLVSFKDGHQERYYMPLRIMRGEKEFTDTIKTKQLSDWPWTNPTYTLTLNASLVNISRIELDPDKGMVDIDYSNNTWTNQVSTNE